MTITTECKCCGKEFSWDREPGVRGRHRRHCSTKCAALWASKNRFPNLGRVYKVECRVCMKGFETKQPNKVACSVECHRKWKVFSARQLRNKPLGVANCEQCGDKFDVTINKRRFCSHSCKGAYAAPKTASDKLQLKKWRTILERRRKCSSCGHAYLESLKQPHRTICRGCRDAARERNKRRTCEDCGVVYDRQKYQSAKRCSACSEERKREVMR